MGKHFDPKPGDYVSFRNRPGLVRDVSRFGTYTVQFGSSGPFKKLALRSLKPATQDQIDYITGRK